MRPNCAFRISSYCIAIVTLLTATAFADWPTYQGNAAHTGFVPGNINTNLLQLKWHTFIGPNAATGFAVGDGTVFVSDGALQALDAPNGNILWSYPYAPSLTFISPPAYSDNTVYQQVDGHSLIAGNSLNGFDARSGAKVFSAPYEAQWETYLNPTPYDGNIYVGGGYTGGMYSFNASTAEQNWFGYVAFYDGWTPALDANYAYAFTGSGITVPITGEFRAIDRATGQTKYVITDNQFQWTGYTMHSAVVLGAHADAFSINEPGITDPGFGTQGRLIFWNLQEDSTHTPHIERVLSDQYHGQPTLANGVLYAVDGTSVAALDEITGNTLWSWAIPTGTPTGQLIATDNLLFVATDSTTYAVDLLSHSSTWSYPASGILALSGGSLYIGSANRFVYAFTLVPEPTSFAMLVCAITISTCARRRRHSLR